MATPAGKIEQARSLIREGKVEQACAIAQQLVRASPGDPFAAALLAEAHFFGRRLPQAIHFARVAVELAPRDAAALCQLAYFLTVDSKGEEAARIAEQAVAIAPAWDHARLTACGAYALLKRYSAMIAHAAAGLDANPGHAGLVATLAGAMTNAGKAAEGYDLMRAALARDPDDPGLRSGICVISNYVPSLTREDVFSIHKAYGDYLERQQPIAAKAFANTPDPDRPIRVGIVSPDLRAHPVATFIEPLLAGLDRATIKVFVYQTNMITDAVTRRLQTYPSTWRCMDTVNDAGLARAIEADAIDVLVDLSGHTEAHSLVAMHLRPAPVIITFCGYPGTTGVRAVHARLVDAFTDPPGEAEACATESLVRLDPCFLCYRPLADAPAVQFRGDGPVTFGSFNALQKINDPLIGLWSRVLAAIPGSCLALKSLNLEDPEIRASLIERFERAGITADRLTLMPPTRGIPEHLASYGAIDIALDTYPYHGTTTTCEAMWMGVPVVTLAGDRHASRVGVSLLHAVGLEDLIAKDEEAYVRLAADLARDAARRTGLRTTLRERVRTSPLCDEPAYCRRFEAALRGLWRDWCEGRS